MRTSLLLSLALALGQDLMLSTSASALPVSTPASNTCIPSFSGLVQSIRHNSNKSLGWSAVLAKPDSRQQTPGSLAGVKAAKLNKKVTDELGMEWLIGHDTQPAGTFALTSVAAMMACLEAQDARRSTARRGCQQRSSYVFEISCASCDRWDDTAFGCQIRSRSNGLCAQASATTGKLSWDTCAPSSVTGYARQLFDIGSFAE